jgi:hypothetical protein
MNVIRDMLSGTAYFKIEKIQNKLVRKYHARNIDDVMTFICNLPSH